MGSSSAKVDKNQKEAKKLKKPKKPKKAAGAKASKAPEEPEEPEEPEPAGPKWRRLFDASHHPDWDQALEETHKDFDVHSKEFKLFRILVSFSFVCVSLSPDFG